VRDYTSLVLIDSLNYVRVTYFYTKRKVEIMINIELLHSLEAEKICFKALSMSHVQAIHSYAADKEVLRFIGWSLMSSIDETRQYVKTMLERESAGTHHYASVAIKSTGQIIGTAMLFNFDQVANQAEIGYVFHRDHWGKGYGSECVALISNFAFETLKLHKLHASVADANIGSARILIKNGFELEGRLKDNYYVDDKYYDALQFGKIQ